MKKIPIQEGEESQMSFNMAPNFFHQNQSDMNLADVSSISQLSSNEKK